MNIECVIVLTISLLSLCVSYCVVLLCVSCCCCCCCVLAVSLSLCVPCCAVLLCVPLCLPCCAVRLSLRVSLCFAVVCSADIVKSLTMLLHCSIVRVCVC